MHVHLVGVAGTGMGTLAGLLKAAGHRVTGSDTAFYPPMGEALARYGVETRTGFDAAHVADRPDLVVVGNVCRKDNPEARAAIDGGLAHTSMAGALETMFLAERPGFVVAGTHGKTTTTTLLAYLLDRTGRDPGLFVGGIPKDFAESFRLGGARAPFVLEGDEYDSAFFEKSPKFWRYRPWATILTSVEHDHIDVYPDEASYLAAFEGLIARIPEDGVLVAWAGDPKVRRLAARARCRVVFYAASGEDTGEVTPTWLAAPMLAQGGAQPFELFVGGTSAGRLLSPLMGAHNVKNATAAMALACETSEGRTTIAELSAALRGFRGIKRRQELLAEAGGVRVYDDFAHHPTAVKETLSALRSRHPEGKLVAVFEPRSATASRNLHQVEYAESFYDASAVVLAPVGRKNIPEAERLDVAAIAAALAGKGLDAVAPAELAAVEAAILERAAPGDTVLIMSNGDFGGLYDRLIARLARR
jgi:UDP-N-acetylmuramate: L-alanyl-gamma-D-glutamyl-meso-diaminopimelate ligase